MFAARTLLLFALLTGAVLAQVRPPVVIEGPIDALRMVNGEVVLTVMGRETRIGAAVPVRTPTTTLTLAQLVSPAPLPGRAQAGFLGATAVITGEFDVTAAKILAHDVFIEPAENVMGGVVTAVVQGLVWVNGARVLMLTDPRLPARPPVDPLGFAIDPGSATVGAPAVAEGYWDGVEFRAHALEIGGKTRLVDLRPQLVVERATARELGPNAQRGDELEVRGAVTMLHVTRGTTTQAIAVSRVDGSRVTWLATTTATPATDFPGFGTFSLRMTTPPSGDPELGKAPRRVRVVNTSPGANGAMQEFDVVVR